MFLFWKIVLFLVLVSIVIVSVTVSKWVTNVKRKQNRKRALEACKDKKESIFVMVISYKDAVAAARVMMSIFGQANCPLRVYIGLYEFYEDPSLTPAVDVYENLVNSSSSVAFSMQDHIRVLRAPASEYKSSALVREQLQRYLYRNETYVLCLGHAYFTLANNWDTYLVGTYNLHKSPWPVVLTTIPERSNGTPSTQNTGTFVGVGGFKARFPKLVAYKIQKKVFANVCIPALSWSASMSFSKGPLPYPNARDISFAGDAEDFVMTERLLRHRWQVVHPAKEVMYELKTRKLLPIVTQTATDIALHPRLGTDPIRKTVSSRGRTGLLPGPNKTLEIDAKLGSVGEYINMLSRVEHARA